MLGVVRPLEFKLCDCGQLGNISSKLHLEEKSSDRKTRLGHKTRNWGLTQGLAPFPESKGRIFEI